MGGGFPRHSGRPRIFCCILVILLLACSSSATGPGDRRRVLGAIAGYNEGDPQITIETAPGSVTVNVTTYGAGCHSKGETEVLLRGREALVTPYDYTAQPGAICTLQLRSFLHQATIDFGAPGPVRIVVRGSDGQHRRTISVERSVVVP